jgi:hypothetical protein
MRGNRTIRRSWCPRVHPALVSTLTMKTADAASADTTLAATRVAQAAADAAANIAVMVAAIDLSLERETAAAAETLHNSTMETARHVDQRNLVVARRASSLRRVCA